MSKKRLIRRMVVGVAALALTSTVIVGGIDNSPPAEAAGALKTLSPMKALLADGPAPNCPGTGNRLYPAAGGAYRGVILCNWSWNGADYFVQVLDLDQGASMRVVSSPAPGSPLGNPGTEFRKVNEASEWRAEIMQGAYVNAPFPADLYSVVNAGYVKSNDPLDSQTEFSLPELKNFVMTTPGFAYYCATACVNDPPTQADWDAQKRVLKLSVPPGTTQSVAVNSFPQGGGNHYTTTDVTNLGSPTGVGAAMDAIVGFTDHSGPLAPNRRTYVGVSNNARKVYVVVTEDPFSEQAMRDLFASWGVIPEKLIKLDGGGSVEMSTRSGHVLNSEDCPLACRPLAEVLAIYEGSPVKPDRGILLGDITHDGREDLVTRRFDGMLLRYSNSGGSPVFPSGAQIGPGWDQFTWWLVGDVNWDQYDDIVAMRYDGTLWRFLHTHNNNAPYTSSQNIGGGWQIYNNVALGDLDPEDGYADILATKPDGTMWRYINSGVATSPYSTPSQIGGGGWNAFNRIKIGDLNRDNLDDIVATKPDGTLWAYTNSATSKTTPSPFGLYQPKQIGTLWQNHSRYAVGDVTGDGFDDIVSTYNDGTLYRFTNGHPFSQNGTPIPSNIFPNPPTNIGQGWATNTYF